MYKKSKDHDILYMKNWEKGFEVRKVTLDLKILVLKITGQKNVPILAVFS